jgi:ATP-dependent helicase/nuclease subunit B
VDVLEGGYVRIVDYKSGAEEFSAVDACSGYQLQLMIYLQAVSEKYKPAGVFYFRIKEPRVEDDGGADIASEVMKSMRLNGVSVSDERVLAAMVMDADGRSNKGKMGGEEFAALRDTVSALIEELIRGLSSGSIDSKPKTARALKNASNRNKKACDFCPYKGICNHD